MTNKDHCYLDESLKLQYAGLFLLYEMEYEEDCEAFYAELSPGQKVLEPVLMSLLEKSYICLDSAHRYKITPLGQDLVHSFAQRYLKFLREFDVYCAVDLEAGDFAFRYYHDYPDLESWSHFLNQDRWDDLRVAVAEFKGWDIVEIIFMSFLSEGSFGRDAEGRFDYNGLLGSIWEEISLIANTAIRMDSLSYEESGEIVSATEILSDMISQGQACLSELPNERL